MTNKPFDPFDDEDDEDTQEDERIRQIIEYHEAHMDEGPVGPPINVRVAKNVKNVYSLRIGAGELDELVDASEAAGMNLSAFIREAALNEARRRKAGKSAVDDVRKKAKELAEAVSKL